MQVVEGDDYVQVRNRQAQKVNIKTLPYPGFPTDLQQPISVFCSIAEGTSVIMKACLTTVSAMWKSCGEWAQYRGGGQDSHN